jgi:subtilisin family serine protease
MNHKHRPFLRRSRLVILPLLLALVAPTVPLAATDAPRPPAPHGRLDTYLARTVASPHAPQRVIIRVRPGARGDVKQALIDHGATILGEHEAAEAFTAVVPADQLSDLAARKDVLSVSIDAVVGAHGQLLGGLLGGVVGTVTGLLTGVTGVVTGILDPETSTQGPEVSPKVLRETLGISGTLAGRNVGVALIDSGLEMSSEFQGRVNAFYDFTNGKSAPASYSDSYGHGTHVAGIIGGSGAQSYNKEYKGLAPSVTFSVFKVLDATGAGYTSDVMRAIDFAVANRAALGIDIINLSLGHPVYEPAGTDPLVQAVERASRAGIIVVAAAGNLGVNPTTEMPGYGGITSPATRRRR